MIQTTWHECFFFGGVDSIAADLLSMLDVRHRCWEPITDDIPALHLPSYHTFIVALILQQLGNFDRRFLHTHASCHMHSMSRVQADPEDHAE